MASRLSASLSLGSIWRDFSELLLYQITWFNDYFLKKLKRNIKSGKDRARAQGKRIGKLEAFSTAYRAYELLFQQGVSIRGAARELGVPIATLYRSKGMLRKTPQPI